MGILDHPLSITLQDLEKATEIVEMQGHAMVSDTSLWPAFDALAQAGGAMSREELRERAAPLADDQEQLQSFLVDASNIPWRWLAAVSAEALRRENFLLPARIFEMTNHAYANGREALAANTEVLGPVKGEILRDVTEHALTAAALMRDDEVIFAGNTTTITAGEMALWRCPATFARLHDDGIRVAPKFVAMGKQQIAAFLQEDGRLGEAEQLCREALAALEPLGDVPERASIQHQLGMLAQMQGRMSTAEAWYRETLAALEPTDDSEGLGATYHQLGALAQERGRLDEAEDWYRKALSVADDVNDRPGLALTYAQLGRLHDMRGNPAEALRWVVRCIALFDEVPHPSTGTGPAQLVHLTERLGLRELERSWQEVTSNPLPPPVRHHAS
jgi:tetratricopeptide (TPR) repeat protein